MNLSNLRFIRHANYFVSLFLLIGFPPSAAPAQVMDVSRWHLNLQAAGGGTPDNSTQLGVDPQATDGYDDSFDFFNPPGFGDAFIDLYFSHSASEPGWQNDSGGYATDFRGPLTPGITHDWRLQVATNQGATGRPALVQITWPNIQDIPEEVTLLLRDPEDLDGDGRREYNMRSVSGFNFTVTADGVLVRFPLVVVAGLKSAFPLPGDINNDGKVNVSDALRALQASVGLVPLSKQEFDAADVDRDDRITVRDSTLILKLAVGIPLPE